MPSHVKVFAASLNLWCLCLFGIASPKLYATGFWNAGFLFDQAPLTLDDGKRTEALGPFYYHEERESAHTIAAPPLFSHTSDEATDSEESDFLYPFITYDRFGGEYRWQLLQLLSWSGGREQSDVVRRRFTLFPVYFQQRSSDPQFNYTAVFPIYGQLQNRLFRNEYDFVLWPLYVKSKRRPTGGSPKDDPYLALPYRYLSARRGDITTYNYFFPFFHLRYGEGLEGWQLWPLWSQEHKAVTTRTNEWGDVETIPGYDKHFVLWPFYFNESRGIGGENPERQVALLPFYNRLRSPLRDSTSYLWPVGLTITDDRVRKYHEVDAPWPFIVFARGEGKTSSRVWPLFGRAQSESLQSDFYLWPVYKYNRVHTGALDRDRTRILFFLYSDVTEKNTETGAHLGRTDLWPLFRHRRDFNGNCRLQILAPIEPLLPNSKSLDRNWSPLWSVWRSENNPKAGATSQSLLWNLYRRETTVTTKKCSLLFGLFQYSSEAEAGRWRVFYIPFGTARNQTDTRSR